MRNLCLLTAIVFFHQTVCAQQIESPYTKQWREIDSLIVLKNLPKTALQKVNSLYANAKSKNIHDEIIKALLYKLELEERTEDVTINDQFASLREEIQATNDIVSKSILQVLLAHALNNYFERNSWRSYSRKEPVLYRDTDINTWSNGQLTAIIDSLFGQALNAKEILTKTSTTQINALLIKGNAPGTRPTVFDLLAHEALDYYETAVAYVLQPYYDFVLRDPHALATADEFMAYSFSSKDTASHLLKALSVFQELIRFHSNDADPTAFIDVNLERIKWVHGKTDFNETKILYRSALTDITTRFNNAPAAAEAWYLLADDYASSAASYRPFGDTTYRYYYVKAKELIEERLKLLPDSCFGNDEMRLLLRRIISPTVRTEAETVISANQPSRMLVSYKNVDTLYARLLRQSDLEVVEKRKNYNRWTDISKIKSIRTWQQFLPATNDYQEHSVEIKIDGLPPGRYTILFSNSSLFADSTDKLAAQAVTVSDLAFLKNNNDIFVVNRETGQPLDHVEANITLEEWNGKKWKNKKLKPLFSDAHGHIVVPANAANRDDYGNIGITLKTGNDILQSDEELYAYRYSDTNDDDEDDSSYEDDNTRVYFFTDKSIYRPGQTVFFKGIVLTKDRVTKHNKIYHYADTIEVDLHDANGKIVDSMFVTLNEYGSFSGKFPLPLSALTGEFSIETLDFQEGQANFNVEEYKRPTFNIEFDTLKNSYRLNDTITVSGNARAYAGNQVDNARITYHIERTAKFPYSWKFWNLQRPYSVNTDIADSVVSVDENGNFQIQFLAVPDSSVDRSTEPVFDFKIEVSATDANGETREASTDIEVGYKSILLQLAVPEIADVKDFKSIYVVTKNNAGENTPALVNIKIRPLETPRKAYRKRLWSSPDQFVMDKQSFETHFPYDEYGAETDYHDWNKLDAILADTFSTAMTSGFKLQSLNLKQGWYVIEATTSDKDGNEVKDVRYVQLYDMNAPGLPSPDVNFSKAISNSGAPGDKAQLLAGTSESNVFLVQKLTRDDRYAEDSISYLTLNNKKDQIEYTISPNDPHDISLYYAFIKHNRFYTGGMQVYVNTEQKDLNITYTSYRNKTEPGSKETWCVQVNDNNNEKAGAELLTSMYDASLDQFKKHEWNVPYFNNSISIGNEWDGSEFDATSSDENNRYEGDMPQKEFDRIATSAAALLMVYRETIRTIEIMKYSPPKIVGDAEIRQELEGKAMGITVAAARRSEFMTDTILAYDVQGNVSYNYKYKVANEALVPAYGVSRPVKSLGYSVTITNGQSITDTSFFHTKIRGITSVSNLNDILVIIDGMITEKKIDELNPNEIDNVIVLKGSEAVAVYGAKAGSGAIVITTKEFALRHGKKKEEQPRPQIRKNFNETAFFFPQLHADSAGNYCFSFTMPDALTTWKWMSFAHTKDLAFGLRAQNIITQKTLMVQPNLPRFLREGDTVELTARVSNLSDSIMSGTASLQLFDAMTNQPLNDSFAINAAETNFSVEADQSSIIKFPVTIPLHYAQPVTVKIIARAGSFSDGEEKMLPVLPNRTLITETLPLYMQRTGTKEFKFDELLNNHSKTLSNKALTVEYTPDPIWYVVQALPYLMQFPYECAEQTFNRFYANALARQIISQNAQIRSVFEKWIKDSSLKSNLEQSPELKNVLLTETPWVNDAESETQQRKNIALLFDSAKMNASIESALRQLAQMQLDNGGFAWFKGGHADRYITQYVLAGIGRLKKLHAIPGQQAGVVSEIVDKALKYADKEIQKDYNDLIKAKVDLSKSHLTELQIQYWYMRSFFWNESIETFPVNASTFSQAQAEQHWMNQSPYMQAMIAISLNHILPAMKPEGKFKSPQLDIVRSLKENAVTDSAKGMYWKNLNGYYWYQSPLEAQAKLIDAFKEITPSDSAIYDMVKWLTLNKQPNHWGSTKATADACYALLRTAHVNEEIVSVSIQLGDSVINTSGNDAQARSGYIKHAIEGRNIQSSMGNISVTVSSANNKSAPPTICYGAVYWQYFEDLDKISRSSSPLSVSKKLFIEKNSDKGKILRPVNDTDVLKVGDKVVIRLVLKSDRDMEYIHLKDTRAAAMEPVNVLSEYKWQDGLGYYESTRDAATNFFIDHLAKGTYVLEYPVYVTHTGNFSAGLATIQCMYAPQFAAHSEGLRIRVEK